MWPAVIAVRMEASLRNTKTNTPSPTLEIIGGENRQLFFFIFVRFYLLTSQLRCGIIIVVERAAYGGGVPIFRSHTPYAKFSRLLATFHMRQIFPETAGGRSVRHMRQRALEFNRHMALQRYLNRSMITSSDFLCGSIFDI